MTTDDRGPTSEPVDAVDPIGAGTGHAEPVHRAGRRQLPWWQEALVLFGAAVVLAVVVKAFFLQAFYIPSNSMEPGLVENDRILVQKVSYWFDAPERGDVVVFEDPGGWLGNTEDDQAGGVAGALSKVGLYPAGGHLVKRVIGVEGDVVTCCDDEGRILVNGEPLDEDDYIQLGAADACNGPMIPCDWSAGPVPEGEVFVMGDNRDNSMDSRFPRSAGGVGTVPFENLVGRADRVIFSSAGSSMLAFWTWRPDRFFLGVE